MAVSKQHVVGAAQAVAMLYMFLGVCAFSVILSIMATIAQHASSTARRASVLGVPHPVPVLLERVSGV